MSETELNHALRRLYETEHKLIPVWKDVENHGFMAIKLIELSVALVAGKISGKVLDIGCGQQPYREYFSERCDITASDIDDKRGNVDVACSADDIPFEDATFDGLLCFEVLEHVPDPAVVLREFNRVLKPGGRLLLSTPQYWPPHELPHDYYRYPGTGLMHLMTEAGYDVEEFLPRGGAWLFMFQVMVHVLGHRIPFIRLWNQLGLYIDQRRLNTKLSLGWTVLAVKK